MTNVTGQDLLNLLVLSLPVAAIAWTVTHEELFRELHDYCAERSRGPRRLATRKFFYLFTCILLQPLRRCWRHFLTRFTLLYDL
jgi:hypothetical protein